MDDGAVTTTDAEMLVGQGVVYAILLNNRLNYPHPITEEKAKAVAKTIRFPQLEAAPKGTKVMLKSVKGVGTSNMFLYGWMS